MFNYFIISIEFYRRAGATSSQKWIARIEEAIAISHLVFQLGHFLAEMDRAEVERRSREEMIRSFNWATS